MDEEFKSNLKSTAITVITATISYLIADKVTITTYFLSLSDPKVHTAVSVLIYSSLIGLFINWILSKRTRINITILDANDKSDKITIENKPRKILVKILIEGNIKNIKHKIKLVFPQWVDFMNKYSPDLEEVENEKTVLVNISNVNNTAIIHYFDIVVRPDYTNSSRSENIYANFQGNKIRYKVIFKELQVSSNASLKGEKYV